MAVGVWLHLSYRGYATLLPDHLILSADTLFLSVGAVGLVTSFLGCCGAWLQSRCLLALVICLPFATFGTISIASYYCVFSFDISEIST